MPNRVHCPVIPRLLLIVQWILLIQLILLIALFHFAKNTTISITPLSYPFTDIGSFGLLRFSKFRN
jgi:hypothetical protein